MGFDKPSDLAGMVGVFVIVLLVGTLGVLSVQQNYVNASITPNITTTLYKVNRSVTNLSNTFSGVDNTLVEPSSAGADPSTENIIVRSWNSLKTLGDSFSVAVTNTEEVSRLFGVDSRIITLSLGILITVFAVIMYAYIRGIK